MIFISFFVDGGPEPDYDAERRFRFFFFFVDLVTCLRDNHTMVAHFPEGHNQNPTRNLFAKILPCPP